MRTALLLSLATALTTLVSLPVAPALGAPLQDQAQAQTLAPKSGHGDATATDDAVPTQLPELDYTEDADVPPNQLPGSIEPAHPIELPEEPEIEERAYPVRYDMNRSWAIFRNEYFIRNEDEEEVYTLLGSTLEVFRKLAFRLPDGQEIITLQIPFLSQSIFRNLANAEIYEGDVLVAEVTRDWQGFFRADFSVLMSNREDLAIRGDTLGRNYSIYTTGDNEQEIASVSAPFISILNRDEYTIEIYDSLLDSPDSNDAFLLAVTVAVDQLQRDQKRW
jgi:uncharacterized protein YxjI